VKLILHILRWTTTSTGEIQKKKKCWNNKRAFGFKLLMGFLPTLARQRAWYPEVYNRPVLFQCAKCGQSKTTSSSAPITRPSRSASEPDSTHKTHRPEPAQTVEIARHASHKD
jgi:hypothetical protein